MYVRGYLQGSENGQVVTIDCAKFIWYEMVSGYGTKLQFCGTKWLWYEMTGACDVTSGSASLSHSKSA